MDDDHSHAPQFARDLEALAKQLSRRRLLGVFSGAVLVPIVGCGSDPSNATFDGSVDGSLPSDASDVPVSTDQGQTVSDAPTTCSAIPTETAGPYPGDGTNGANFLALTGILRSDIRASLSPASGTAPGVPLTITLTLVNASGGCAPLQDYAIYLWHCDRDGSYSMYSGSIANENFLRGVQTTNASGQVTFTSIFPAAYSGRWPHIHFEIYRTLAATTNGRNAVRTSQLALPQAACNEVYATTGYEASVRNLAMSSLSTDNVFSDGSSLQLANVVGNVSSGYTATLTVAISV